MAEAVPAHGPGESLGYETKKDGVTIGLLRKPSIEPWDEFTCLNSLRDVEPPPYLILDDHHLDDEATQHERQRKEPRPMMSQHPKRCKVGELRPSQVLTTFGIGSIIDLPNISVMVMGLEDWPVQDTVEIGEERLLASVREVLGPQVQALRSAPVPPDTYPGNPFEGCRAGGHSGRPVSPLDGVSRVSPLGPAQQRPVQAGDPVPDGPDSLRPCELHQPEPASRRPSFRRASSWPARMATWTTSRGGSSSIVAPRTVMGGLKLFELTATGEAASIEVRCEGAHCGASRRMSDAFKTDPDRRCRSVAARRPQLRDFDEAGLQGAGREDMRMAPCSKARPTPGSRSRSRPWRSPRRPASSTATRRGALDDPGESAERAEYRIITAGDSRSCAICASYTPAADLGGGAGQESAGVRRGHGRRPI